MPKSHSFLLAVATVHALLLQHMAPMPYLGARLERAGGAHAGDTDFLLGRGPCTVVAEETLATINLDAGVSALR